MKKNQGVLVGKRPEDYVAGRVGASIPYEVINETGNWSGYLPKGELQRSKFTDSMACVSFSALNSIETQLKYLTGIEFNLSDRFTAKMSGTTPQGNYLYKVGDSIRKDGCVPETLWSAPKDFTWADFYKDIPNDIIERGKEFLEAVEISYEWIPLEREQILKHLKQAPLQIVVLSNTHAVLNFHSEEIVHWYFDHYEPFIKSVHDFTFPMKYVVKIKDLEKLKKFAQENTMRLERKNGEKDVWAIDVEGKKHLILNYQTLELGKAMRLWDGTIKLVDEINNPEGNVIILTPSD